MILLDQMLYLHGKGCMLSTYLLFISFETMKKLLLGFSFSIALKCIFVLPGIFLLEIVFSHSFVKSYGDKGQDHNRSHLFIFLSRKELNWWIITVLRQQCTVRCSVDRVHWGNTWTLSNTYTFVSAQSRRRQKLCSGKIKRSIFYSSMQKHFASAFHS